MSETVIRVLVADDHLLVRKGFAMLLHALPDLQLVGEAANGREAIEQCAAQLPDVVLMDMRMPEMDGVEATRAIRRAHPQTQVVALTSFSEDAHLLQKALEAGVIGYLFKTVSVNELAEAIRNAYEARPTLAPQATMMLIQNKTRPAQPEVQLSEREHEVLVLLCRGLSNREIATDLFVSPSTIKFHVSSILGKLGATSRTEAVSIAHHMGLVK